MRAMFLGVVLSKVKMSEAASHEVILEVSCDCYSAAVVSIGKVFIAASCFICIAKCAHLASAARIQNTHILYRHAMVIHFCFAATIASPGRLSDPSIRLACVCLQEAVGSTGAPATVGSHWLSHSGGRASGHRGQRGYIRHLLVRLAFSFILVARLAAVRPQRACDKAEHAEETKHRTRLMSESQLGQRR